MILFCSNKFNDIFFLRQGNDQNWVHAIWDRCVGFQQTQHIQSNASCHVCMKNCCIRYPTASDESINYRTKKKKKN